MNQKALDDLVWQEATVQLKQQNLDVPSAMRVEDAHWLVAFNGLRHFEVSRYVKADDPVELTIIASTDGKHTHACWREGQIWWSDSDLTRMVEWLWFHKYFPIPGVKS